MDFDNGTLGESLLYYILPVNTCNNIGKPAPTCSWSLGVHSLSKISFPLDLRTPQKHLPMWSPPGEHSRESEVNCANTCPLVDLLRWSLQLRGSIPSRLWATALAWIPCGIVAGWRPPSTIHLFNIASLVVSCCMAILPHSVCRNTHRVIHLLHVKICVTSVRCLQRVFSLTPLQVFWHLMRWQRWCDKLTWDKIVYDTSPIFPCLCLVALEPCNSLGLLI